jgi:hypothetical protein
VAPPPDFPRIRDALLRAAAAAAAANATDEGDPARKAAERTWDRAQHAYADELLWPVLGTRWLLCCPVSEFTGRAYPRTPDNRPLVTAFPELLGRPLVYVRCGAPAPLGPSSCAFVAHHADAFDASGCVKKWVLEQAAVLAHQHGFSSWARPGLVPWYADRASLLVATGGLSAGRAAEFGFTALADAACG